QSNISRPAGKARKYPAINYNYESVDFPGLFIAGTVAHSLDFKKSAGGFIHGFRFTSQALHHLLEWRFEGVKWPSLTVPINQLINMITKRLNEGSGIYQMYGILGDVIIINRDDDTATYLQEIPMKLLHERFYEFCGHNASEVIVLYLDYGWLTNDLSKFESVASEAHLSYFLHPVLYYYKQLPAERDLKQMGVNDRLPRPDSIHHIVEDFLVFWESLNEHIRPLRRWLEHILHKNLRQFYSEKCFHMALTHRNVPESCQVYYLEGRGLFLSSNLANMAAVRRVIMSTLY
ncbi:FAD-dependent oxidoreductase domain-containing protein 2, partial [Bulinus truncatus]